MERKILISLLSRIDDPTANEKEGLKAEALKEIFEVLFRIYEVIIRFIESVKRACKTNTYVQNLNLRYKHL